MDHPTISVNFTSAWEVSHRSKRADLSEIAVGSPDAIRCVSVHRWKQLSSGCSFFIKFSCGCLNKSPTHRPGSLWVYLQMWLPTSPDSQCELPIPVLLTFGSVRTDTCPTSAVILKCAEWLSYAFFFRTQRMICPVGDRGIWSRNSTPARRCLCVSKLAETWTLHIIISCTVEPGCVEFPWCLVLIWEFQVLVFEL